VNLNCLIGPLELIPGIIQSHLPRDLSKFLGDRAICERKEIYAHNIKISNISEVDRAFNSYLR